MFHSIEMSHIDVKVILPKNRLPILPCDITRHVTGNITYLLLIDRCLSVPRAKLLPTSPATS